MVAVSIPLLLNHQIWTVYMELYVSDPVQMIVKYWENIITFLVNQFLGNPDMDEIVRLYH